MSNTTPLPTDECELCGMTYENHAAMTDWCPADRNNNVWKGEIWNYNKSFTPKKPSTPKEEPAPSHSSKIVSDLLNEITPEEQKQVEDKMMRESAPVQEGEHTPGPWHATKKEYGPYTEYAIQTIATDHVKTFIGEVGGGMQDDNEIRANAELISRAPALLSENERLKERIKELEAWMSSHLAWVKASADGDKCHHGRANVMRAELDFIQRELEAKLKQPTEKSVTNI